MASSATVAISASNPTITDLRCRFDDFKPKRPIADLQHELTQGWMLSALLHLDQCLWGRWDYWARCSAGARGLDACATI